MRRLEAYVWSSYPGYVDAGKQLDFVCDDLLADYGRTLPEARRQYRAYVHACVLEDDGPILEAMAASWHAIGGERFVEQTERRLAIRRSGSAVDRDLDLPQRRSRSSVSTKRSPRTTGSWRRTWEVACAGGGAAKFVAVELACRLLTGMTQRAIGALRRDQFRSREQHSSATREGQYALSDVVRLNQQIIPVSS